MTRTKYLSLCLPFSEDPRQGVDARGIAWQRGGKSRHLSVLEVEGEWSAKMATGILTSLLFLILSNNVTHMDRYARLGEL